MTKSSDPLARVRATIAKLDPDRPLPFDGFRHRFDTPNARVSTPKAAESLDSRHFRRIRHPAATEGVRSTLHHAPSAVDDDVHHTSAILSTSNSVETVESVEKALKAADSNSSIFDTRAAGVSRRCRKDAGVNDNDDQEFPIVVVDDRDLPIWPCGWCGGRIFWRPGRRWIRDPRPLTDLRWRCRQCVPVTADVDMPNVHTLLWEDPGDREKPYAPCRGEARATILAGVEYEDGLMPVQFPLDLATAVDTLIAGGKSVVDVGRHFEMQDCEIAAIVEAMEGRRRNRDWPSSL